MDKLKQMKVWVAELLDEEAIAALQDVCQVDVKYKVPRDQQLAMIGDYHAELDLAMREADVAIRLHRPNQSEMIQRKLFTVHNHFYASKAYLAEFGEPTSVDELDRHRIISFGEPVPSYLGDINYLERMGRSDSSPRRAALKVNAIYGMLQACRAGIGIAMLPDYVTETEDDLVQVMPEVELPAYEAYFVYPPALKNSKRVGVFRDFLVAKAREWSF